METLSAMKRFTNRFGRPNTAIEKNTNPISNCIKNSNMGEGTESVGTTMKTEVVYPIVFPLKNGLPLLKSVSVLEM